MGIHLHIPPDGLAAVRRFGLRHAGREKLRLVYNHPASSYRGGALLRGQSADVLDGAAFAALAAHFDARIECDSADTRERVLRALGLPVWADLCERVTIVFAHHQEDQPQP